MYIYIYCNSLMVSLQLFADTDKDGYLCSRYRDTRDAHETEEDFQQT